MKIQVLMQYYYIQMLALRFIVKKILKSKIFFSSIIKMWFVFNDILPQDLIYCSDRLHFHQQDCNPISFSFAAYQGPLCWNIQTSIHIVNSVQFHKRILQKILLVYAHFQFLFWKFLSFLSETLHLFLVVVFTLPFLTLSVCVQEYEF